MWLTPLNLLNNRGKKFARRLKRGTKDTEYPEDEVSLDDVPPELLPIRNERSVLERNKIVNVWFEILTLITMVNAFFWECTPSILIMYLQDIDTCLSNYMVPDPWRQQSSSSWMFTVCYILNLSLLLAIVGLVCDVKLECDSLSLSATPGK